MPLLPPDVDLAACLFGGQAFTWWHVADRVEGTVRGTHVVVDPVAGVWTSTPTRPSSFFARYLGGRRTLPDALESDDVLAPLAVEFGGLRLLEQDPWEGLLQFMLSPVNNVPRIQENIARLARALGPRVGAAHGLPSPSEVTAAGPDRLRALGLGFRGPRLWEAAVRIEEGALDLDRLRRRPVGEAREALLELEGVGPKVAECVLCYALAFDDAFPVDRWVARACEVLLGRVLAPEEARELWGDRAAMAQQLLFHGARMGLVEGVPASPVVRFDRWRGL